MRIKFSFGKLTKTIQIFEEQDFGIINYLVTLSTFLLTEDCSVICKRNFSNI